MSEPALQITLINKRGRIIRIDKRELKECLDLGMKIFPNPKQEYYAQYDETFNSPETHPPIPGVEREKTELKVIEL